MLMGCVVKVMLLLESFYSFYSSNVHAIFLDWELQLMYDYDQLLIKGNTLRIQPGLLGVACSPILSVSLEGMGCEPVLILLMRL